MFFLPRLSHEAFETPIKAGSKRYDDRIPDRTQKPSPGKSNLPPERPVKLKVPTIQPAEKEAPARSKMPIEQPAESETLTAIPDSLSSETGKQDIPSTNTDTTEINPETLRISTDALFVAVENDDLEAIKAQLALGAPIDALDDLGFSALHYATDSGQLETVKFLIASGCEIDKRCSSIGLPTALHLACAKEYRDIAKVLLDAGADPNIKTEVNNDTVLNASVDRDALWAVKMLLESGKADVDSRDTNSMTPLHSASRIGNIDIVRLLFAAGADKLAKSMNGRTALHYAAMAGKEEVVRFLLEQGIPVDIRSGSVAKGGVEYTAFHYAAEKGFIDIMQVLIDRGANVNVKSIDGVTPLMRAAQTGSVMAVKLLLEKGAEVDCVGTMQSGNKMTALGLAKSNSQLSIIKVIQRHIAAGKGMG
jgi:ankyrin repeat protein